MIAKVFAFVLLVCAPAAAADPATDARERAARVEYYANETMVAERVHAVASTTIARTRGRWDDAVRDGRVRAAGYWAKRHADALVRAREARQRAVRLRFALGAARGAFDGRRTK